MRWLNELQISRVLLVHEYPVSFIKFLEQMAGPKSMCYNYTAAKYVVQEGSQLLQVRHASKKAGGSTKNRKGSNAQRLGVKLFHGQACKPGSIIIRQRGTKWRPADNVGLGKDHTIFSLFHGHVEFFKHPQTKRTHVRVQPNDDTVSIKKAPLPFNVTDPMQLGA